MRDLPPAGTSSLREVITAVRQLMQGRSNATGRVTLTPGATTTTFTAPNLNEDAEIFLTPRTLNAAGALATTVPVVARVSGALKVTITHANAASTDRTFGWEARGG